MKLRPYKADAQFLLVFYFLLAKKARRVAGLFGVLFGGVYSLMSS
jgi:hypothetical protein